MTDEAEVEEEVFTPFSVGRYEAVLPLGDGGMGRVYLAEQRGVSGFTKCVVIKLIHEEFASNPRFVSMFIDEAKIAVNIRHPNVVEVLELQKEGTNLFMALEFVDGCDLNKLMRSLTDLGEHMQVDLAVHVMSGVLSALNYAHNATGPDDQPLELIHRDVTPGNILISRKGEVKLTDFGVARAAGRTTETVAGEVKGKFRYMAPEVLLGENYDQRCDLFSAGAVLWESLTGERLFDGKTDFKVMEAVLRKTVPAPSTINPSVPAALDEVVLRALSRDVSKRFESARAFRRALMSAAPTDDMDAAQEDLGRLVMRFSAPRRTMSSPRLAAITAPNTPSPTRAPAPVALGPEPSSAPRRPDVYATTPGAGTPVPTASSTRLPPIGTPVAPSSYTPPPAMHTPANTPAPVHPTPGPMPAVNTPPPRSQGSHPGAAFLPVGTPVPARTPSGSLPNPFADVTSGLHNAGVNPSLNSSGIHPAVAEAARTPTQPSLNATRSPTLLAMPSLPSAVGGEPSFYVSVPSGQTHGPTNATGLLAALQEPQARKFVGVGLHPSALLPISDVGRLLMFDHLLPSPIPKTTPQRTGAVAQVGVGSLLMRATSARLTGLLMLSDPNGAGAVGLYTHEGCVHYTFAHDPSAHLLALFLQHHAAGMQALPHVLAAVLGQRMDLPYALMRVAQMSAPQIMQALASLSKDRAIRALSRGTCQYTLYSGVPPPYDVAPTREPVASLLPLVFPLLMDANTIHHTSEKLLSHNLRFNVEDETVVSWLGLTEDYVTLRRALEQSSRLNGVWARTVVRGTPYEQRLRVALVMLEQCGLLVDMEPEQRG